MHEVVVTQPGPAINTQDLCVGEIAELLSGVDKGSYVLRTYQCFVLLNKPSDTWDLEVLHAPCRRLPPGTELKITVGG